MIDTTNAAFAENESPAAALSVDGAALTVLMIQPTAEELGDQKATLIPGGKPTLARMTKTEQRQLWAACTLSRAVATIAEAFAVAQGIQRVNLAVVSQRVASSTRYSLVLAGESSREVFRVVQWPAQVNSSDLARSGSFLYTLDRVGVLAEIATDNDPHLHALVDGINGVIEHDDTPAPPTDPSEVPSASVAFRSSSSASATAIEATSPTRNIEPRQPAASTIPLHAAPDTAPEGRPFQLWGRGNSWGNVEIKGTQHRQDAILSLLPRHGLRGGAELDATAHLVPEPTNPFDPNAVGRWIHDQHIGYLSREDAARYAVPLAQLVRSGLLPTTSVHVWAREFDDYDSAAQTGAKRYFTSARVALADPDLLAPVNLAPPKPRAELPDGGAAKVTGTHDHLQHLLSVLRDRSAAWAYGVLEPLTVTGPRSSKTVVQVLINGQPVGMLSPQMSTAFLPIVQPLTERQGHATVRVFLQGSPVSVAATVYAARAHEIPRIWFETLAAETGISFGAG